MVWYRKHRGSVESPKQDQPKEIHMKTHYITKTATMKAGSEKQLVTYKGTPIRSSGYFGRNFADQK